MVHTKNQVTQQMIDTVFSDQKFRKKFTHPRKDKSICQMRSNNAGYSEIAKRYRMSKFYCRQCVERVVRLYRVFIM